MSASEPGVCDQRLFSTSSWKFASTLSDFGDLQGRMWKEKKGGMCGKACKAARRRREEEEEGGLEAEREREKRGEACETKEKREVSHVLSYRPPCSPAVIEILGALVLPAGNATECGTLGTDPFGVLVCLGIMFTVDPIWAAAAIVIVICSYMYINGEFVAREWGSAMDGVRFQLALKSLIGLEGSQQSVVNWHRCEVLGPVVHARCEPRLVVSCACQGDR